MGVALRDIIIEYKKPIAWEGLAGIAAVDAHNALYQFLSIIRQPDGTPLMDSHGRITSHLSGILFRTLNFLEMGIRSVYVFDGEPPHFKQGTIETRRGQRIAAKERWQEALEKGEIGEAYKHARSSARVDAAVIDSSWQLLHLLGVPSVQAPSEGEAQAAFMAQIGDVQYSVSQDYDSLLFGSPVLARNLTVSGKRKVRGRTISINPERIILKEVLNGLSITREQLVEIALLVGTDFNEGVHGIGAKTALKIVKRREFGATLEKELPDFDPVPIMNFFLQPPVNTDYKLSWTPPDREGIRRMLCDQYEFSPERIDSALDKLATTSGQKTLDRWF
ncbi:MAG: flap endonuclease-1 [Methanomicrobiales archaeon]|nr:flap endonuclease-1 [Methanomicrobiales archaeon]